MHKILDVHHHDPESTSRWIKFQQGYLDLSEIPEQSFTSAIDLSNGKSELTGNMKNKKLILKKSPRASIWYIGFNMIDPVVGGYDDKKRKLRQAISIAIDTDEYIKIFNNGRGNIAHSIIPPGIFGYEEGKSGYNPYIFDWDDTQNAAKLKSIDYAKKLLAEAGYPNGIDNETGKQLNIFLNLYKLPGSSPVDWYISQLNKLNINLQVIETDGNRLQEIYNNGSFQMYVAGWNADYPDPENFLFMLYGPNGKIKFKGENTSNYSNVEYDKLFDQIKSMSNGPDRLTLIKQAVAIIRKDCPWKFNFFPVDYVLYHDWYENAFPSGVINNSIKYQNINLESRTQYRDRENNPRLFWPLSILISLTIIFFYTAFRFLKKEMN